MTLLQSIGTSQVGYRLGWALIHSLWLGAGIGAGFAAAILLLRRRSANARYLVGCIALVAMVAMPAAVFLLSPPRPAASTALPTGRPEAAAPADVHLPIPQATPADLPADYPRRPGPQPLAPVGVRSGDRSPIAAGQAGAHGKAERTSWWQQLSGTVEPALPWIVLVWCLGVLLLSARQMYAWIASQWLTRLAVRPPQDDPLGSVAALARAMSITRPVRLLNSAIVRVPTVIGWLKPVVLLPVGLATAMTPQQIEAILAHELAHIRRHDYLVNLLQSLAETLLFYHPLVWVISRRIRIERENCCDDLALAAGAEKVCYAESLLHVVRYSAASRRPLAAVALGAASRPSALRKRITRLLGRGEQGRGLRGSWPLAAAFLAVALAAACFLSCTQQPRGPAQPTAQPATPPTSADQEQAVLMVEDFFRHNYRDITKRETIQWGQAEKDTAGNLSIRYKYLATIWGKDRLVIDEVFTFSPEGKFISARTLDRSPVATQASQPQTQPDGYAGAVRPRKGTFEIHVEGADLRGVLQLLGTQGRKNIIATKEVTGTVTTDLYGVTFYDALEAVVASAGYAWTERGNVIYVGTAEQIAALAGQPSGRAGEPTTQPASRSSLSLEAAPLQLERHRLEAELDAIRKQIALAKREFPSLDSVHSVYETKFQDISKRLADLEQRQAQARADMAVIEAQDRAGTLSTSRDVQQALEQDSNLRRLQYALSDLVIERNRLAEKLGPQQEQVLELDERIKATTKELEAKRNEVTASAIRALKTRAQADLDGVSKQMTEYRDRYNEAMNTMRDLQANLTVVQALQGKEEIAMENLRRVEARLQDIRLAPPATQPAEAGQRWRRFVMLVVGKDAMTFQGQPVTWEQLPAAIEKVPDRSNTVLAVAMASDEATLREQADALGRAADLGRRFGFEYTSYVGVHPLGTKGGPTQPLPAPLPSDAPQY